MSSQEGVQVVKSTQDYREEVAAVEQQRDDRQRSIRLSEMVEFVRLWHPYGGGNEEEIYVTFGISAQRMFELVLSAFDEGRHFEGIGSTEEAKMRRVCRARLWVSGADRIG